MKEISTKNPGVGRKRKNFEVMSGRFPAGTFARMDSVLEPGEARSELLRHALEQEISRRERILRRRRERPQKT